MVKNKGLCALFTLMLISALVFGAAFMVSAGEYELYNNELDAVEIYRGSFCGLLEATSVNRGSMEDMELLALVYENAREANFNLDFATIYIFDNGAIGIVVPADSGGFYDSSILENNIFNELTDVVPFTRTSRPNSVAPGRTWMNLTANESTVRTMYSNFYVTGTTRYTFNIANNGNAIMTADVRRMTALTSARLGSVNVPVGGQGRLTGMSTQSSDRVYVRFTVANRFNGSLVGGDTGMLRY